MAQIALPRVEDERVLPLTVVQVRALAEAMPERSRAMVYVQAGLGLRIGELLALRVQDVDFLRRTVRVEHQLERGTRATGGPEDAAVTADDPSADDGRGRWPRTSPRFLRWPTGRCSPTIGRPFDHNHLRQQVFGAVVDRLAAVKGSTFPAATTTHDLRHHYASVLLAAGESVVAVAERLGHEDATMVLRVYGHLLPDSEDRTRKAVDDAWRGPEEGSGGAATAQGRPK